MDYTNKPGYEEDEQLLAPEVNYSHKASEQIEGVR